MALLDRFLHSLPMQQFGEHREKLREAMQQERDRRDFQIAQEAALIQHADNHACTQRRQAKKEQNTMRKKQGRKNRGKDPEQRDEMTIIERKAMKDS